MSTVDDLISRQQEINAEGEPAPQRSSFDELLDRAEAYMENRWEPLDVVLGGELLPIEIGMASGAEFLEIASHHPPEVYADVAIGYNRNTLPRDYPTARIRIDGAPTTEDTWHKVWDLLDVENKLNVSAVIWGLNIGEPKAHLEMLTGEAAPSHISTTVALGFALKEFNGDTRDK